MGGLGAQEESTKGRSRSSFRATLGKSTKWTLGVKLWSQKGISGAQASVDFPCGAGPTALSPSSSGITAAWLPLLALLDPP